MKLVFASDSFKGSLSSAKINALLQEATEEIFPHGETVSLLMADGGEGTVDALVGQLGGEKATVSVHGPLFEPVEAQYGILPQGIAVIEMAAASGLPLVPPSQRDPMKTTTFGVGQLVQDALSRGVRKIVIAIGGSATNDGGMGMLSALGVRFLDQSGTVLRGCGSDLEAVDRIDRSGLYPGILETEFVVMCDVNNPLLGERGCAFTFAAQKGAGREMQQRLEQGMSHYADLVEKTVSFSGRDVPGAGAAGGLGFALMAFLGARLQSGIDTVLDLIHFDEIIRDADLVVTGEGRMDWQSAYGKVPAGVGKRCRKAGVPAVAIVGGVLPGYEPIYQCGIETVMTTISGAMDLQQAMKDSEALYRDAAVRLFRAVRCGMKMAGCEKF